MLNSNMTLTVVAKKAAGAVTQPKQFPEDTKKFDYPFLCRFGGQDLGAVSRKSRLLTGRDKYIFKCFFRRLHSDYRHGTWPMFS